MTKAFMFNVLKLDRKKGGRQTTASTRSVVYRKFLS